PLPVPPTFGSTETVCPVWRPASELSVHTGHPAVSVEGRPNPPSDPAWDNSLTWDESTVVPPFNAVVFEGDRINATTRTVQPTAEDRWFNIGCARHTLSKMRLSRNTLHTTTGGWQQVQATLKMLSADYCGTGKPFTVAGTPIVWQQNPPGMTYRFTPAHGSLEARWNENGAMCLDTPRLELHPDPGFPDIRRSIASACARSKEHFEHPLPACGRTEVPLRGIRITTANWSEPPAP
ncbi:MAG: ADYC domain-containing protein, partial [bacterium]